MLRYITMDGLDVEIFPDGETALTIPDIGIADDIVLVGGCPDAQAAETFLAMAYEIAHLGPRTLTVVNTYFRHARCDRKFTNQAVMAKFQARLWSGLGIIYPGVKLVFLDIHNDMVLGYFEGAVHTSNVSALGLLESQMQELWGGFASRVYATVDYGGVYAARRLADKGGFGFAHIDKVRLSGSDTQVREVYGDVDGQDVVIFDDMISTGGSLNKAAQAYKKRGARRVFAVATHGLFVGDLEFDDIAGVLVTNSHPNAAKAALREPGLITVYPLLPEQLVPPVGCSETNICQ